MGAAKKIIAGSQTPPLPAPPTPTSKRIVAQQRQSFGNKNTSRKGQSQDDDMVDARRAYFR